MIDETTEQSAKVAAAVEAVRALAAHEVRAFAEALAGQIDGPECPTAESFIRAEQSVRLHDSIATLRTPTARELLNDIRRNRRPAKNADERWEVAVHEAAHAIVVIAVGGAPLSISIDPDPIDGSRGECRYMLYGESVEKTALRMIVEVAGYEGVALICGDSNGEPRGSDLRQAVQNAVKIVGQRASRAEIHAEIERARRSARAIIESNRHIIIEAARAVLEFRRRLEGFDVVTFNPQQDGDDQR